MTDLLSNKARPADVDVAAAKLVAPSLGKANGPARRESDAVSAGGGSISTCEETPLLSPMPAPPRVDGTGTGTGGGGGAPRGLISSYAAGILCMVLAAVCQSFMSMSVHVAQVTFLLPVPSLFIVRVVISLATSVLYLVLSGNMRQLIMPARALLPLAVFSVSSSAGSLLLFYALAYIPAGTAATLSSVAPILTSIAAAVLFGDAFTLFHGLALLLNLCGIYFVVMPASSAAAAAEHHGDHHQFAGHDTVRGVSYALAAACANTTNALAIKQLGGRLHPVILILGYSIGCALLLPLNAAWHDVSYLWSNHYGLLFSVASAFFGFSRQVMTVMGLSRVPAGIGVVTRTLNVPLVFVLALLFLGERPTLLNVAGVLLVIGSVLGINLLNTCGLGRRARTRAPAPGKV